MPITFTCSQCKARMTVPDALAGKRGKCSKCKGPIVVPGSAEPAPTAAPVKETPAAAPVNGAAKPAAKAQPAAKVTAPAVDKPPPAPPSPPPAPNADVEADAMAALADAQEEEQAVEFIAIDCPMCGEAVRFELKDAGKRTPCPECKRIVQVPIPEKKKRTDWRDTGPKLPAGARKPTEPTPEGAWGTGQKTGPSDEALKEAGVIQEKRKPLTLMQRARPYLLFGVPVVLLFVIGMSVWGWMNRTAERRAFEAADSAARAKDASTKLGVEGQAALYAQIARYHVRGKKPGSGPKAREALGPAISLATRLEGPARDVLLLDLIPTALDLGGDGEDRDAEIRLKWDDIHKLLGSTLASFTTAEGKQEAVRRMATGLAERGQAKRVVPLITQAFTTADPTDKTEAIALAGLGLLTGKASAEATAACQQVETAFADKAKPSVRPAVVALPLALGRPLKFLGDEKALSANDVVEMRAGRAGGYARLGKLDEARSAVTEIADRQDQLKTRVEMSAHALAGGEGAAMVVQEALDFLKEIPRDSRARLDWELLRLVGVGLQAGVSADKFAPVLADLSERNPPLAARARLLVLRDQLSKSRKAEPLDVLTALPEKSAAGLLARLELTRHNVAQNGSMKSPPGDWSEGAKAFGSLGVALGMQNAN